MWVDLILSERRVGGARMQLGLKDLLDSAECLAGPVVTDPSAPGHLLAMHRVAGAGRRRMLRRA
jgi:hypothetical protein